MAADRKRIEDTELAGAALVAAAKANDHLPHVPDEALAGEFLRRRAERLAAREIVEREPRPSETGRQLMILMRGADVLERGSLWEL